jgi:hypothetical protein
MAKWGDGSSGFVERWADGRFAKSMLCDFCCKPIGAIHYTDSDVCGDSDDPGFYLCGRKRCEAKREKLSVEERRVAYAEGRARGKGAA